MNTVSLSCRRIFRSPLERLFLYIPKRYSGNFRQKYDGKFGNCNMTSWFPGHMYKGMLQLQAKLAVVDCVIEVHDARIPISGRNPKFYTMLAAIKPHILVLNKSDLADQSHKEEINRYLNQQNIKHIMYTNCKESKKGTEKIVPLAVKLIKDTDIYTRGNRSEYTMMVIGIPNVGKSSLINRLRNQHLNKKKATTVGAIPGITKSVLEKIKVYENPDVYLYDSPGIMQPSVENLEVGLRLGLCRTLKDSVVGIELIADYLLYWLNKNKKFSYVEYLELKEPTDSTALLLMHIATKLNKIKRVNNILGSIVTVPDLEASSYYFVNAFREGKLGKFLLDTDYLNRT